VTTPTETDIRHVLDAQIAALRAKDAQRYVTHYAPDVVSFDLAPPLQHVGLNPATTSNMDDWFATWDGPIVQEIAEFSATIAETDGIAFCHGLVRMRGDKIGEGPLDLWFRATWGLRLTDGTWKITHEHSSTPFYMDGSYRAATDLVP